MQQYINLAIIEDNDHVAHSLRDILYKESLGFEKIEVVNDIDDFIKKDFLLEGKGVFIVDINLGPGRENEGLDIVRMIKNKSPESLAIIFSAYSHKSELVSKSGADYFFTKGPHLEDTIKSISKTIKAHQKGFNLQSDTKVSALFENADVRKTYKKLKPELLQNTLLASYKSLLDGINHDLRNSLIRISHSLGEIKLQLTQNSIDDKVRTRVEDGIKDVKISIKNIDNLLNTYNTFGEKSDEVDIDKVIIESIQNFKINYKCEIDYKYFRPAVPENIICNKLELSLILSNLLSNAIYSVQAKEKTVPEIKIKYEQTKGYHIISIQDNGVGISKEYINRIYDAGFTTSADRIGVGLSIAKSIIESLQGSISCISRVGIGTTFSVKLPVNNNR